MPSGGSEGISFVRIRFVLLRFHFEKLRKNRNKRGVRRMILNFEFLFRYTFATSIRIRFSESITRSYDGVNVDVVKSAL